MFIKRTILFLGAALIGTVPVAAQSDTVYIYEDLIVYDTIVVYDTVFVEPPIRIKDLNRPLSYAVLRIDTLHQYAQVLHISPQKTATIPIDRIIFQEDFNRNFKNLESMKKYSFFGLVFMAFQSMVLAQTNYEIALGTGLWWENGPLAYVEKPYSGSIHLGIYAKRNFSNKATGIRTGLEYGFLSSSGDYKYDGTPGVWHSEEGHEFANLNRHYARGQHSLSIPLLLYYERYRIRPFLGINYNYLITNTLSSKESAYFADSHNLGFNLGLGWSLGDALSLQLACMQNLTSDYGEQIIYEGRPGSGEDKTVLGRSFDLRHARIQLSIVFTPGKGNAKQE